MNATIKLVHANYEPTHLEFVKSEMSTLGSPIIRAVDLGDNLYQALEGCHRLRAAEELGVPVTLELVDYSDDLVSNVVEGFDSDLTINELCDDFICIALVEVDADIL